MARPVMLSNGQMLVGLNEQGLVHDFYYPYVGLDNLTTSRSVHHKIGVWVDGDFSWVDDASWSSTVEFEHDALISNIVYENSSLGIKIESKDCVDTDYNAFVRHIKIYNLLDKKRAVRLFMHQVFQISRSGRADTAFYEPQGNYILDYKGRCALLIFAQSNQGPSDQYAVGNYGIEDKAGTFMDAVDGELSNNAVEHGGVDSVIRISVELSPNDIAVVDYWIIASSSQYESEMIHKEFLQKSASKRIDSTRQYWQDWLNQSSEVLNTVSSNYKTALQQSLLLIKAHIDNRGGILASGDSSIFNYGRDYYCYVWPRDGAYAIWPLIRMGIYQEAINYFEFCRDTLHRDGYLMHKYQPDRAIGSTWHPLVHNSRSELAIQEDETAIVLVMLGEYYDYSKDEAFVESLYSTLIQPTANFMSRFIDDDTNLPHASYDLWEEKFLTTTYTTATVVRALRRSAEFAERFDYPDDAMRWLKTADKIEHSMQLLFDPEKRCFRKGLLLQPDGSLQFDNTIDSSSLYGLWMYTRIRLDNPILVESVNAVESNLKNNQVGGIIRYEGDWYMRHDESVPPNPWFVCSLWLAQYYIQINKNQEAEDIMNWSLNHAYPSGALSEQVDPISGKSVGVAPLVWSHAEVVNTILDLTNIN